MRSKTADPAKLTGKRKLVVWGFLVHPECLSKAGPSSKQTPAQSELSRRFCVVRLLKNRNPKSGNTADWD